MQRLEDEWWNWWDNSEDDPSRGFLFLALFRPPGTRMIGFSDDGAHANGTVDEGGEHLLNSHHVREEHHVLYRYNVADCQHGTKSNHSSTL